jgi:Zn finger protein HypA/HybF involved in hydrogenase expression
MKILDNLEISEIKKMLNDSDSFREFLLKIGSSSNGSGSYKSIKNQIAKLGIDIPEFSYKNERKFSKKLDDSQVFIENSTYCRHRLKERIIKNKLIEYKCESCGNGDEWNGKKLVLHLEHKNGINNDNKIENLCFLCPNCHTQTETYSGKNKVSKKIKVDKNKIKCKCGKDMFKTSKMCLECNSRKNRKNIRPNLENLKKEIDELGYSGTGRKYNVSDNAIRKWLKNMTS